MRVIRTNGELNGHRLLIMIIIIIFIVIISGLLLKPSKTTIKNTINIGDVWEFYENGNPFMKNKILTRRVINIKMGYVEYVENNKDTLSVRDSIFLINSSKIK